MADERAKRDVNHVPTLLGVDNSEEEEVKRVSLDTDSRTRVTDEEGHQFVWDTGALAWVRMEQPTLEADSVTCIVSGTISATVINTPSVQSIVDNVTINPATVTVSSSVLPSGASTEATLQKVVGLDIGEWDKVTQTQDATHDYWAFELSSTPTTTVTVTYTDATKTVISTVEIT